MCRCLFRLMRCCFLYYSCLSKNDFFSYLSIFYHLGGQQNSTHAKYSRCKVFGMYGIRRGLYTEKNQVIAHRTARAANCYVMIAKIIIILITSSPLPTSTTYLTVSPTYDLLWASSLLLQILQEMKKIVDLPAGYWLWWQ